MQNFNKVVIVGGGTAGWMAAAALSKTFGEQLEIRLIESDAIPTVGVGEATIPAMQDFHRLLGVDESEFMRAVHGTFKLGIEFEGWGQVADNYMHAFGVTGRDSWAAPFHNYWLKASRQGVAAELGNYCLEENLAKASKFSTLTTPKLNYAYHLDASLYAKYLRSFSEKLGVQRIEGLVDTVSCHSETGFIESVTLASGQQIEGDLFIDCSGFRGLLIEQTLHTGYEDWSHWLPCDRAVAVQTKSMRPPVPYTRSIARSCGWQWQIPLQHRVGNGLVYCSRYLSDEDAKKTLLDNVEGELINEPRVIKFQTGRRLKQWNKNCVALGLASGFLEPLESTSIHLIHNSLLRLIKLFPAHEINEVEVKQFNREVKIEAEAIRDFIILHYHATQRADSAFWDYCRTMDIPETLAHKIDLFKSNGRIFREQNDLFLERSWALVLIGQGVIPAGYHPIVETMPDEDLAAMLQGFKASHQKAAEQLCSHADFIDAYCKSN